MHELLYYIPFMWSFGPLVLGSSQFLEALRGSLPGVSLAVEDVPTPPEASLLGRTPNSKRHSKGVSGSFWADRRLFQ